MSSCVAPRCGTPAAIGAVFCDLHMQASDAQRGGWLSAARRRKMMGGMTATATTTPDAPYDASNVAKRLWVGAKPPFDRQLAKFGLVVLCAEEIQPPHTAFTGVVHRCPLPDAKLNQAQTNRALMAGRTVATALASGQTVLVTCHMGINRSALVAGLGLGLCTRLSSSTIIELMRQRRHPEALYNEHFREILHRYIGVGRKNSPTPT